MRLGGLTTKETHLHLQSSGRSWVTTVGGSQQQRRRVFEVVLGVASWLVSLTNLSGRTGSTRPSMQGSAERSRLPTTPTYLRAMRAPVRRRRPPRDNAASSAEGWSPVGGSPDQPTRQKSRHASAIVGALHQPAPTSKSPLPAHTRAQAARVSVAQQPRLAGCCGAWLAADPHGPAPQDRHTHPTIPGALEPITSRSTRRSATPRVYVEGPPTQIHG